MLIRTATVACAFAVSIVTAQSVLAQYETAAPPMPTNDVPCETDGAVASSTSSLHSDWESFKRRFHLDTERNEAWPHPFVGPDRQAYREMFRPCYDRGWEIEHSLSDACFDAETGELNRLGAAKVAQMVRSAPANRKTLFVYQSKSPDVARHRVDLVRNYIQAEYGRSAGIAVATTRNYPETGSGTYAETISRQWQRSLPSPTLRVQSVSGAVGGAN